MKAASRHDKEQREEECEASELFEVVGGRDDGRRRVARHSSALGFDRHGRPEHAPSAADCLVLLPYNARHRRMSISSNVENRKPSVIPPVSATKPKRAPPSLLSPLPHALTLRKQIDGTHRMLRRALHL